MRRFLTCCLKKPVPPVIVVPQPTPKAVADNTTPKGHLYIIKEREFIKTNENIYKIGKSTNIQYRMPKYPKNSVVYGIVYSQDVHKAEKELIERFDERFKQRPDIGREYYEVSRVPVVIAEFVNVAIKHL